MEIKNAEKFISNHDYGNGKLDKKGTIEAMKAYAQQFIDLAADKAKTNFTYDTNEGGIVDAQIDKQSILDIKQLIK